MTCTTNAQSSFRSLVLAGVVLTLVACASAPRQGMYWGNYESSLYRLADEPSDRVQQQHLTNLRQVVSVSDARGWPPPPGAMLELAMMEQQRGNSEAYALLVNREYHLYPESRPYIQRWFGDVMVTIRGASDDEPTQDESEAVADPQNGNDNESENTDGGSRE